MQFKFIKTKDPNNEFDRTNVIVESEAVGLPEILGDIKEFLLACGFIIEGDLVVEEYEDLSKISNDEEVF